MKLHITKNKGKFNEKELLIEIEGKANLYTGLLIVATTGIGVAVLKNLKRK